MPGRPLGELRGVAETGRYRWLTWDRGTYDPRPAWEDGPGGGGVIGTIDASRPGASAMSWTPSLRRRGYCAAVVGAMLMMPRLEHVELFAADVGSACAGLADCLRRAGFEPLNAGPDWEGMTYYAWFRHPAEPR